MSDIFYKQFDLARGLFLKEVASLPHDIIDVQPKELNNTIHWHIGHVLTVTEQFLFGYPKKSTLIPEDYKTFFGNGTKPSDWNEEIPSMELLVDQLKGQLDRIKGIPSEQFDKILEKPILGLASYEELASMAILHETNHLGQIHAMKLLLKD